jgi:hypothetical protein
MMFKFDVSEHYIRYIDVMWLINTKYDIKRNLKREVMLIWSML